MSDCGEGNSVAGAAGIDLNLLAVLGALLEHRNVTRAGEKLRLSQPTMKTIPRYSSRMEMPTSIRSIALK